MTPFRSWMCRAAVWSSCFVVGWSSPAAAGDWPQILGPQRDGKAAGEKLADSWPAGGPRVLWSVELGEGYAGPAVAGKTVVAFHRRERSETISALDVASGKPLWQTDFPASYRGGVDSDHGPRCVPLVHGGRVFAFGAAGDLHCVDLATGKRLWSRALYGDYEGEEGYFGAGSTPIVADDKLLVNVGGKRDAGLVALALDSGRTVWKTTTEDGSYSSPTSTRTGGRTQVIFVTRMNTVGVDPANGQVQFRFPFGRRGPTVNAATPIVFDGHLFVTSSYGVGARLAKLGGTEAVWENDDVLSSQYATPIHHDGHLYGIHGREDIPPAHLMCVEATTGRVRWSQTGFGVANAILAGDRLLLVTTRGTIVMAAASPERYRELGRAEVAKGVTRALPALSEGRLFLRTNERGAGGSLVCVAVGP